MMKHFLLTFALLLPAAFTAQAQWSDDPAVNNRISPSNLGFYDPCYLTNQDGVTFYHYLVPNQKDGVDCMQSRLQIYDAQGKRQLGASGVVVCNERNITWTKFNDYVILDNDGNLILSAYDLRQSAADKYDFSFAIYKYSPKGEMLWSEPVILNEGRGDAHCMGLSMCATDDGGTAYVYSATSADGTHLVTHLERLDKDGKTLWDEPLVVEPDMATNRPFVVNNTQNEVMVLYADADVQYNARVFDAEGHDVWEESVPVYSGGYSDGIKIYPSVSVEPGPDGGVFFCVMDGGWEGRLVYLTKDGQYGFPTANLGTKVAGPDYQSTMPAVYYNPADQMIYTAFANMAAYGQNGYGLYAQKFTLGGQRQWGDDGICIEETATGQQTGHPFVRPSADGRLAIFHQKQTGTAYGSPVGSYITLIDTEGNIVAEPQNFTTSAGVKNNFGVSPLIGGNHYIASWTEKRANSTAECIFSQYVSADGSTVNGIETIGCTPSAIRHSVFDLQGRSMDGELKKGIYVIDGKKFIKQ
ncbi:MAG: hypothetical protein J6M25_04595 [Prevotella sp.]|nr:hypothetical protein [Prevotella sp.]